MLPRGKATRVDSAYDLLKSEILKGELPPGFQAPEPDIAGRLGMSRTPVREALIRLESEGLVELVPRRGARILSVTTKDFLEIHQILSLLEGLAASIIARMILPKEVWDELTNQVSQAEEALASGDFERWSEFDDQFHRSIGKNSNHRLGREISRHLNQIYRANRVLLKMNRGPSRPLHDNRDLLKTLQSGDAEAAERVARLHRLEGMAAMKSLFDESGLSHL